MTDASMPVQAEPKTFIGRLRGGEFDILVVEPALERREVRAIGRERVWRETAFHPDRIEKPIDRTGTGCAALPARGA